MAAWDRTKAGFFPRNSRLDQFYGSSVREMIMLYNHVVEAHLPANRRRVWIPRYASPIGGDCLQKRTSVAGINLLGRYIHTGNADNSRQFIEVAGEGWTATISLDAKVPGVSCRECVVHLPRVFSQVDYHQPCSSSENSWVFLSAPKLRGIHAFKRNMTVLKLFCDEWVEDA